ncbi:hypothetical protein LJC42_08540 [Eubacteriales bacterium OttesenSCG-928-K08]|nr:hypothetical protein [Eubacteriales bacterium OttesenSCG-928-K08]
MVTQYDHTITVDEAILPNGFIWSHPFGESLPINARQEYLGTSFRTHSLREDNLIDQTFNSYWERPVSLLEAQYLSQSYADSWVDEARHALELIQGQANPYDEIYTPQLSEVLNTYDAFVRLDAELYANIHFTNSYSPLKEDFEYEAFVAGRMYPGCFSMAYAAHYRSYTFYLCDLLTVLDVEPNFVFDPEEIHSKWGYLLE